MPSSMKIDTSMQYDFLPINVTKSEPFNVSKSEDKQSYKDEMASHLEANFNDQTLRQAKKTQSNVRSISNVLSRISIEESKKASGAKTKKCRSEYYKIYKKQSRQSLAFKSKERESKQFARRNPVFRAKENVYQKKLKQSARKDPLNKRKRIKAVYKKKSCFYTPRKLCLWGGGGILFSSCPSVRLSSGRQHFQTTSPLKP